MKNDPCDTIPTFFIGIAIGVMAALWLCQAFAVEPLKKEAVERGYAEWVVNASGDAKWQWKEAAK